MKKRWVENIFVRFMRFVLSLGLYCVMWSEHRKAIKVLNRLYDRELKDISREDIDRMVWQWLEEDEYRKLLSTIHNETNQQDL